MTSLVLLCLILLCSSPQIKSFVLNNGVEETEPLISLVTDGHHQVKNIPGVNYLILALRWPLSVCYTSTYPCNKQVDFKKLPVRFTIHGLWTQPDKTCPRNPPTFQDFTNVLAGLRLNWPDIIKFNENNQGYNFWVHEYNKHGTCVGTVEQYYQQTLNLYQTKQIATLHTRAKIVPGIGEKDTSVVLKSLTDVMGVRPILICNTDPLSRSQLFEVRFHLTTDFTFIDATGSSNCAATVRLPSAHV